MPCTGRIHEPYYRRNDFLREHPGRILDRPDPCPGGCYRQYPHPAYESSGCAVLTRSRNRYPLRYLGHCQKEQMISWHIRNPFFPYHHLPATLFHIVALQSPLIKKSTDPPHPPASFSPKPGRLTLADPSIAERPRPNTAL